MTTTPLDEVDDRILLRRHVAGDREAFGEVYRRHRDRMWAVAVGVCGDRELAAEAVQEGFVSAFRRADSFRGDAQVTTWLHRIVVNASIDQIRKARPTAELTDEVVSRAPAAPDSASRVDTRLAVHEALHSLPEGQRLALVLVDMHGLPVAEAAQVLGADRRAAVCRELTKTYEEVLRGTLGELAERTASGVLGEIVVVVAGADAADSAATLEDLVEIVEERVEAGERLKDACAAVSEGSAVTKRELYQAVLDARG